MSTRTQLHTVPDRYGLAASSPRLIADDSNTHWMLRAGSDRLVLCRYRQARNEYWLEWLLAHLKRQPVDGRRHGESGP